MRCAELLLTLAVSAAFASVIVRRRECKADSTARPFSSDWLNSRSEGAADASGSLIGLGGFGYIPVSHESHIDSMQLHTGTTVAIFESPPALCTQLEPTLMKLTRRFLARLALLLPALVLVP